MKSARKSAALGTPAAVYDVDGLRDSTHHATAGFIAEKNTPEELAKEIIRAFQKSEEYAKIRECAWRGAKEMSFEKSYKEFARIIV